MHLQGLLYILFHFQWNFLVRNTVIDSGLLFLFSSPIGFEVSKKGITVVTSYESIISQKRATQLQIIEIRPQARFDFYTWQF